MATPASLPCEVGTVTGLFAGTPALLSSSTSGRFKLYSSIDKQPLGQKATITKDGVVGDQPTDSKDSDLGMLQGVHGGPERAVMMFNEGTYDDVKAWIKDKGAGVKADVVRKALDRCFPPAFGENVSVKGMLSEATTCIGDIYEIGDVKLEVCQPRDPCFKLVHRFGGFPNFTRNLVVEKGIAGWFSRVLQGGDIKIGDRIVLIARPNPELVLKDLSVRFHHEKDTDQRWLARLKDCPQLSTSWRTQVESRMHQRGKEGTFDKALTVGVKCIKNSDQRFNTEKTFASERELRAFAWDGGEWGVADGGGWVSVVKREWLLYGGVAAAAVAVSAAVLVAAMRHTRTMQRST
ncbi:unnamed protein product [Vitrella brassicaformis CCMP3155]|uniref:MOSC domain-containing protein n=2 Tax=Vitrella brassicaformis TaxID=1169539 RepID=A0A0G4H2B0_VITBC|nr:unnamed protein product [Vitrella brassicaformis CCMP3155]|eukprot:CEM37775.1 unnamed protein product [Vitrella brassicaformis CCMP3155]